jgi:hypothetical protein
MLFYDTSNPATLIQMAAGSEAWALSSRTLNRGFEF